MNYQLPTYAPIFNISYGQIISDPTTIKYSCNSNAIDYKYHIKANFSYGTYSKSVYRPILIFSQMTNWTPNVFAIKNYNITFTNCPPRCRSCDMNGLCTSCYNGSIVDSTLSTCVCSSGYYEVLDDPCYVFPCFLCQACHFSCLTCTGGSEIDCLTCSSSFQMMDGKCITDRLSIYTKK